MTEREKEILNEIRKNPLISQKELGEKLNITRTSVAVHIGNLIKKGHIKGKGYVLKEENYVTVIGGSNVDIQGFPNETLVMRDSNPGKVKMSLGGVGRNIAENLAKLSVKTKLVSAIGDDLYGEKILTECRLVGIDMDDTLVLKNFKSSTYLSVLDDRGDMVVALSDMDIIDNMTVDFIMDKQHTIKNSRVVVIDTNIPREVIENIVYNNKDQVIFLDTVSSKKAEKIKDLIGYFHTIKPNKIEMEALTGVKISTLIDMDKACSILIDKGVKRIFLSLGSEGLYYKDENTSNLFNPFKVSVINATGAGDAFMAGLVYSYLNDFDIDYTGRFSMASSVLALSHQDTINPAFSEENVIRKLKELRQVGEKR